jgi:hypothetical protein
MCRFYSTPMQNQTYSMNVSDISEDEIDEAVSEALHGIIKAMDLWKEKKSFHQKVTDELFTILKRKDLTIFDVLIKRDEKVCEILDEPTKDVPRGKGAWRFDRHRNDQDLQPAVQGSRRQF